MKASKIIENRQSLDFGNVQKDESIPAKTFGAARKWRVLNVF